jgi:hypothetical protein
MDKQAFDHTRILASKFGDAFTEHKYHYLQTDVHVTIAGRYTFDPVPGMPRGLDINYRSANVFMNFGIGSLLHVRT